MKQCRLSSCQFKQKKNCTYITITPGINKKCMLISPIIKSQPFPRNETTLTEHLYIYYSNTKLSETFLYIFHLGFILGLIIILTDYYLYRLSVFFFSVLLFCFQQNNTQIAEKSSLNES